MLGSKDRPVYKKKKKNKLFISKPYKNKTDQSRLRKQQPAEASYQSISKKMYGSERGFTTGGILHSCTKGGWHIPHLPPLNVGNCDRFFCRKNMLCPYKVTNKKRKLNFVHLMRREHHPAAIKHCAHVLPLKRPR